MSIRGKKYYRKLFFHLVEITVWNSYLLFQSMGNTMKHLKFRMQLIELLVANHKEASPATHGRPGTSLPPMKLTARHFPACIPATEKKANPTRVCTVCSRRTDGRGKKIRRESRYYCPDCGVGLCVAPCFRDYHTKVNLP